MVSRFLFFIICSVVSFCIGCKGTKINSKFKIQLPKLELNASFPIYYCIYQALAKHDDVLKVGTFNLFNARKDGEKAFTVTPENVYRLFAEGD